LGLSKNEKYLYSQVFPFQVLATNDGMKYLGFHLKANWYKKGDWQWLIAKVEKKLNTWCNQWLSRGG
jgi:hypothetical protein